MSSFLVAVVAGVAGVAGVPAAPVAAAASRIVSVGDIHGSKSSFAKILEAAALIDESHRWIGGSATLVQTGDFLDRGPDSLEVMDLMMELQRQAEEEGGRVVILLGNHEVMNMIGVYRDVSTETYEKLVDGDSAARRKTTFKRVMQHYRKAERAQIGGPPVRLPPGFKSSWHQRVPLGFLEYQQLMSKRGRYGKWLRSLPSAFRAENVFFVHGGISPAEELSSAEEISAKVRSELESWDDFREILIDHDAIVPTDDFESTIRKARSALEKSKNATLRAVIESILESIGDWYLLNADSPLWFRGFAKWSDVEGQEWIDFPRDLLGVDHFVVGHTPVRNRLIEQRFDGAVFLTDTGMLQDVYKGRPAALEIRGELFEAIYSNERLALWEGKREQNQEIRMATHLPKPPADWPLAIEWQNPNGEILPFADDDHVLEFLATAEITATIEIHDGISKPRKLTLEKDGIRAHAVFRSIDIEQKHVLLGGKPELAFRDSYRFEPAAYELSRLLGLGALPPTTLRTIDGIDGSIQLWVESSFTESARERDGLQPPDPRLWFWQLQSMYLFDNLIDNFDRNQGNILIGDDWRIALIDHTRSFRTSAALPEPDLVQQCERTLWTRLKNLDSSLVRDRLKAYLSKSQLRALERRRQALVGHIGDLIEVYGSEVLFAFDTSPLSTHEASRWRTQGLHLKQLPERSEVPQELLAVAN